MRTTQRPDSGTAGIVLIALAIVISVAAMAFLSRSPANAQSPSADPAILEKIRIIKQKADAAWAKKKRAREAAATPAAREAPGDQPTANDETKQQAEAEARREADRLTAQKQAEEKRKADAQLAAQEAERKQREARRKAEEQKRAERKAAERAAQQRKQEQARAAAQKKKAEQEAAKHAAAQLQRQRDQQAAEQKRLADAAAQSRRLAEERRLLEQERRRLEAERAKIRERRERLAAEADKARRADEERRRALQRDLEAHRKNLADRRANELRREREVRIQEAERRRQLEAQRRNDWQNAARRANAENGNAGPRTPAALAAQRDAEGDELTRRLNNARGGRSALGARGVTNSRYGPGESIVENDHRVTILLIMEVGKSGVRRWSKTADPMLCVKDKCYLSNGSNASARELLRSKAFGPSVALGTRGLACRSSPACVFRDIDLRRATASLQPVDLKFLRHDRRDVRRIAPDETCTVERGALLCDKTYGAGNWRAWVIPEEVAKWAGPQALEAALKRGLK